MWLAVTRPLLTAFPRPLCSEPLRFGPSGALWPVLHLVPRVRHRQTLRSQSQHGDKTAPVRQNLSVVSPHRPGPSVRGRVHDGTQEDFAGAGHPVGTAAAQAGGGVSAAAAGTEVSRGHQASDRGGLPPGLSLEPPGDRPPLHGGRGTAIYAGKCHACQVPGTTRVMSVHSPFSSERA